MIFSHPINRDVTKTFHDSDPRLNVPSTSSANQQFILPPSQSQFFVVFQFLRNPIGEEDWQLTMEPLVVLQFPEVSISEKYKVSIIYTPPPQVQQFAPEKLPSPKVRIVFQPSIFTGAMLNFGGGISCIHRCWAGPHFVDPFAAPERPSGKDEGHPFAYIDARSGAPCGE